MEEVNISFSTVVCCSQLLNSNSFQQHFQHTSQIHIFHIKNTNYNTIINLIKIYYLNQEARKKEKFAEVLTAVEDLLAVLVLPTRRKVEVKEAMRESSTESDAGSEKSEVSLNQTESDAHSEKSEMVVDSTDPESESSIDVQSMKRTLEETNDYAVLDARRRNKRRRL